MGKVLTVMNMKGGVGKTTISCHLAALAGRNELGHPDVKRILLIDYDPQFNASQTMIGAGDYDRLEKDRKTVLSILVQDPSQYDPFAIYSHDFYKPPKVADLVFKTGASAGQVDIIVSTLDLMFVALGQPGKTLTPMKERFSAFIKEAKAKYDLVIIDCHPAGSVFTQTSLSTSDHVLIPVKPERYALRGVGLMKRFIDGRGPQSSGIVPHIVFNETRGVSDAERAIRGAAEFRPLCLGPTIGHSKHFRRASQGTNFMWDVRSANYKNVMKNLNSVLGELLTRMGL